MNENMSTIDELCAILHDEPHAEAYAGDAGDMIADGDKPLDGLINAIGCVYSELYCLSQGDVLDGTSVDDDLETVATGCVRATILLLHTAAEARRRIRATCETLPAPVDTQLSLLEDA